MSLYNQKAETRSLYIHWPFCPYKCHFCPFVALAKHDQFMGEYHKALLAEINTYAQKLDFKPQLDTIYFGGGTPSTYPNDLLLDTFGTLNKVFTFNEKTEVTIELNPGTVQKEQFMLWKKLGINRLSIGVQSLKDIALQKLNRIQTTEQVYQALQYAEGVFENVSVDLIVGLPGVTASEWKAMLQTIMGWTIKHISIYFLTVHENTQLYFGVKKQKVSLPPDDTVVDLYYWSVDLLKKHGFEQYEISNFARDGQYSRHNKVYWDRKPYKAFGLGACSFDGTQRLQNEKNLMKYNKAAQAGQDLTVFQEILTPEQERLEIIMLGLRQKQGLSTDTLYAGCSPEKKEQLCTAIKRLKAEQLVIEDANQLQLTPAGLAVQNSIVIALSE